MIVKNHLATCQDYYGWGKKILAVKSINLPNKTLHGDIFFQILKSICSELPNS